MFWGSYYGCYYRKLIIECSVLSLDVCAQPKDQGPCKAYFERWYYDQEDGFCKHFVYGGCEGNGNRFESEEDCRTTCNANAPVGKCIKVVKLTFVSR